MTKTLWPGLHDDGVLYSTVVINQASGHGNTFAVYSPSLLNKNGAVDFSGHGQLYYPVVSALLKNSDYESYMALLHASNLVGFVLAFAVFTLTSRRVLSVSWLFGSFYGLAGSYGTVSVLQYLQGRPEHAIPFVLLLFALFGLFKKQDSFPDWLNGLQIGLIGSISPLPGVIAGLGSVWARSMAFHRKGLIPGIAIQSALAAVTWLATMTMTYDGSIVDWFRNTFLGASWFDSDIQGALRPWFFLNVAPGLGFIFLATSVLVLLKMVKFMVKKGNAIHKVVALVCMVGITAIFVKHGIFWAPTNYCFLPFLPSIALWTIGQIQPCVEKQITLKKNLVCVVLMLIIGLSGVGYLRSCVFQSAIVNVGSSFKNTLQKVNEIKDSLQANEIILIDAYRGARSPVVFDSPPWKMRTTTLTTEWKPIEDKLGLKVGYYLILQFSEKTPSLLIPLESQEKFKLVYNSFNQSPIYIFGFKIKETTPGYGIALYERIKM